MAFVTKFYSLKDPITGGTTKRYGWSFERAGVNIAARADADGVIKVNKHEPYVQSHLRVPKGESVKEISETEFHKLDTSDESMVSRIARERQFLNLRKLQRRFGDSQEIASADAIEERLNSVLLHPKKDE